tara:strand:+ start:161 stop:595 length:435 start_codon:yes stop_codon:yes gene_type:complete
LKINIILWIINEYIIFKIDYSIKYVKIAMDNYSHTPGPTKNSAKLIISNMLKKNKSDWTYISDDDIENTVNKMIDKMYPNNDDDYCLGSGLGWLVSVEKVLHKNGINELNELNESKKKDKAMLLALTLSFQDKLPAELIEEFKK